MSAEEGGKDRPLTETSSPQVFCQTWNFPVYVKMKEGRKMVMPGEDATLEIIIKSKMVRVYDIHVV